VVNVRLDKATNRLATEACPDTYTVAFIAGTEPKDSCDQAMGEHRGILTRIFGPASTPPPPIIGATSSTVRPAMPTPAPPGSAAASQDSKDKKKGFFGKIVGIFKGDDKPSSPPPQKDSGNKPH
jgi:penicillin-binding protein 1B